MAADRPAVPAALKRQLYEESGYRCAIPTCGTPGPLELAHIEPWAKVREHVFENMIALCRNDHFRFDNGEIPVQSVRVFKANLAVVHNRYSEIERRLLKSLGAKPAGGSLIIDGGDFVRLSLMNVVSDGLVSRTEAEGISIVVSVPENPIRMEMGDDGRPRVVPGTGDSSGGRDRYALTTRGVEFVSRWFGAEPLLTL